MIDEAKIGGAPSVNISKKKKAGGKAAGVINFDIPSMSHGIPMVVLAAVALPQLSSY